MNEIINENIQVNTITTLEIAEMLDMKHYKVLEKLEGTKDRKTKGIIEILTHHDFVVSEYFVKSTYNDTSGKENKCYLVTKLGCDFLANKFTGEKGILFTAKYVKRFNDMEKLILSSDQLKAQLLLSIYDGGQNAVLASKQLTELEVKEATAPLIEQIETDKPYTEFAKHVTTSSDSVDIGEFAKIVKNEKIDIGRNRLFKWLRENKYLMGNNIPYQKYLTNDYFDVVEVTKETPYGTKIFSKTLIKGKGQISLVEKLRKEFGMVV